MRLTVKDAAKLLDVSEKTIYRWLASDTVPHTRVGDQYRFSRSELIDWAVTSGKPLHPQAVCETESDEISVPAIHEIIRGGGIHYRIAGSTPQEALREIVSVLRLPTGLTESYLFQSLTARENLASTGIGEGVAIPHTRHPLVQLAKPFLALSFLAGPVDWHAVDAKPVRIVFVLCCPTMRSHLKVLSRLTFLLRDPSLRALIEAEGLRDELLQGFARAEKDLLEIPRSSIFNLQSSIPPGPPSP